MSFSGKWLAMSVSLTFLRVSGRYFGDASAKLKYDPTKSFQTKNNSIIKKLATNKLISEDETKYLTIHNSVAPKIYGLPKIHKPNTPLRPIVSCIQSPFYKLSKYLSNILSKITCKNDYT